MRAHVHRAQSVADEALYRSVLAGSGKGPGNPALIFWDRCNAPGLFALPNDNDVPPRAGPPWDARHYFTLGSDFILSKVHIKADANALGSFNTITGQPTINVDLYMDGAFVETLATIAAGNATFDITVTPGTTIPANSLYQFMVDASSATGGSIGNFLFNAELSATA
jgi:hypothetical protein